MDKHDYIFCFNSKDIEAMHSCVGDLAFVTGKYLKKYVGPDVEIITIPEGFEYIGECVFFYFKELEGNMLKGARKNLKNVKKIILPDSVVKMDEQAFAFIKPVEQIVLSNKIRKISNEAFKRCENLKEVILPQKVECIGENAFFCCEKLTNIVLPDGIRCIESGAFHNCASLKKINIPGSVSIIMPGAFSFSGITEIEIAEENSRFEYIKGLLIKKDSAGNKDVIWANHNVVKYSCIIPSDITGISERAFNDCKELTMLHVHDSLRHISDNNHWTSKISIYCSRNSYAHKYAEKNNLKTVLR